MMRRLCFVLLFVFLGTVCCQELPVGLAAFAAYNQLGTPRWTGGLAAIYPVVERLGVYATTTADLYPKKAVDPVTGRQFYAISASTRQGVHYRALTSGKATFLLGGDLGPGFSQGDPSGIKISLTSSFVATMAYQITPKFYAMVPIRMLYVSGIGWNPVAQAGVVISLRKGN